MNEELSQIVEGWYKKIQKRLAPITAGTYINRTTHFIGWCSKNDIDPLNLNFREISRFVEHKQDEGATMATINNYLFGLLSFYNYVVWDLELLDRNPVERYKKIAPIRTEPARSYRKAKLADVLRIVFEAKDRMARTMAAVFLECGLRAKELSMIDVEHLNLTNTHKMIIIEKHRGSYVYHEEVTIYPYTIYIRWGKGVRGENPRHVILVGPIRQILKNYLKWRELQPVKGSVLFFNQHGRQLSLDGVRYKILAACEELKIKSGDAKGRITRGRVVGVNGFYPRQLRPIFRSEMSKRGMDPKVMDMQMGHKGNTVGEAVYNQRTYEERLREHLDKGPLLI